MQVQTTGHHYSVVDPLEDPELSGCPLISGYVFVDTTGVNPEAPTVQCVYVPEDDQYITDPAEVINFLYRLAPFSSYTGAYGVEVAIG